MSQEDSLSEQNILYSSRSLPSDTRSFFSRADRGSITSTLYQPPSSSIQSLFERSSKNIIPNQGNLKEADDGEKATNGSTNYAQHVRDMGIKLDTFSSPDKLQRLHIKSYEGTINGEEVGLLSTGNLSKSSMLSVPLSKSQRQHDNFLSKIPFIGRGQDLYQLNTAIELHNKSDINSLKSIQQSIIKNHDATSTGNFLIGPDANTALVNSINNASINNKVLVSSPYLDDPSIINALYNFTRRGGDATLITSNPDSIIDRATGGSVGNRKKLLYGLEQSGATVYMPDVDDPILTHYKGAVIGDDFFIGSNNFTNAAFKKESLDVTYRGRHNQKIADQLRNNLLADVKDFEFIKKTSSTAKTYAAGITNDGLSPFFDETKNSYILPSQYGTSHFFEKAIYNAMRRNAGASISNVEDSEGYATAAYRMKYLATHGESPTEIPWYIKNYDKEMATPGLSYYVNEWAIRQGYGRIYKEENGPLASLAGLVGSFLDRSLTYYGTLTTPDYIKSQQEISPNGIYKEPQVGFFQNLFSFATNYIIKDVTSVLSYVTLGVPYAIASTELFRASSQGLLDFALSESKDSNFIKNSIRHIGRAAATGMSIGIQHTGKSPQELREFLIEQAGESKEIRELYKSSLNSLLSMTNLIENQRTGTYFDMTIRPFVENIVNPYNPRSFDGTVNSSWSKLQNALNNFRTVITAPAFVRMEGTGSAANFIVENIGYAKHKKIAEALDELGSHLPANPMKWGLLGHNYTDPKNEIINGKEVVSDFVKLNEVFSFTGLLRKLERIYYGGEYLRIVNEATVVDETSELGRAGAKIKSALGVPSSILGRAKQVLGNVYKSAFLRLQGKDTALGDILQEHKKLRKIESDMLGKAFKWNTTQQMREVDLTQLSDGEIDSYLHQLGSYNKKIDPHRVEMLDKAVKFAAEQEFAITKVRNPHIKLTSNWFLNNVGNIFLVGLSMFAADTALKDLFENTKGASLTSQAITAIMHRDVGATPEFTPTTIFGFGGGWMSYVASIGYTAFSIATGVGVASLTDGINRDLYHVAESSIAKVKEYAARHAIGTTAIKDLEDEVLNNLGHAGRRGTLRPAKNFFTTALAVTTGLLVARGLSRHVVASALNIIRTTPVIGEFLFGHGEVKLNEKSISVSKLQAYRAEVIRRMQSGRDISAWSAMAAYQTGIETGMIPLIDQGPGAINPKNPLSTANPSSKDMRVITNESRLPYIRFFTTEINKGRTYGENGEVINKGMLQFKFGIESAPLIGADTSFAIPIQLNLNSKNRLGVSIVYNNEGDQVLNYLQSVSSMGANALLFATTLIGTLDGIEGALSFFNKDASAVADLKEVSNIVKTSFKTFYNGLELLVSVPTYGFNFVNARIRDASNFTKSVIEGFVDKAPKANQAVRKISAGGRIGRGIVGAFLGFQAFAAIDSIFTQDDDSINTAAWTGLYSGGLGLMFIDKLASVSRPMKSSVSRIIKPLENRLAKIMASNILSKVPLLPKKSSAWVIAGILAGSAWLITDSQFGLAKGMDDSYDYSGKITSDNLKKLSTVGFYTALTAIPIFQFSDFGKSPIELLESYMNSRDTIAALATSDNPLRGIQSKYHSFNAWKQEYHVRAYLDSMTKYIHEGVIGTVNTKQLSEAMLSDEIPNNMSAKGKLKQALNDIAGANTNKLEKLIASNAGQGIRRVFQSEEFLKFSKGTSLGRKVLYAGVAYGLVTTLSGALVEATGHFLGGRSGQQAVNDFYDHADGFNEGLANAIRLISWRDKKGNKDLLNPEITLDENGLPNKQLGYRLMNPNDPQQQKLTETLKNVMAPFLVDPLKQSQSILPNIGVNLKQGEYGLRIRGYVQEHSGLQDTSFSVYSTLPAYMFKMALEGNRQWQFLIEDGIKIALQGEDITSNTSDAKMNAVASVIMATSAQLSPLMKPRKYSTPITQFTKVMVGSNSLLSMSLLLRMRRTSELSYQSIQSISNRMVDLSDFSIMNTISNRVDYRNPLASVNLQFKTKNYDINLLKHLSKHNIKDLIREIFASGGNGRLQLTQENITVDRTTKEVSLAPTVIQDDTEWLQQEGSLFLDTASTPDNSYFSSFAKLAKGADDYVTGIPFIGAPAIKMAATAGASLAMVIIIGGGIGSFFYNSQQTRFKEATNLTKNIFGRNETESFRAFHVNNRIMGPGTSMSGNSSFVINGRGNIFTISLPEGVSLNQQALNDSLQGVMINTYNVTQEVRKDIFGYIEGEQFKWDTRLRSDVVLDLKNTLVPMVDRYIDNIFETFTKNIPGANVGFGHLISSNFRNPVELEKMKTNLKAEITQGIEESIEKEIADGKLLGEKDLLRHFKGYAGKQAATQLAHSIFQKIIPTINKLDKSLLFLEPEDSLGYLSRVSNDIISFVKESGEFLQGGKDFFKRGLNSPRLQSPNLPTSSVGPSEELLNDLTKVSPIGGRYRTRALMKGAWTGITQTALALGTAAESVEIFSGFYRTSAYEKDPNRTEGEVSYAAQGAAFSLVNSVGMSVVSHLIWKKAVNNIPKLFNKLDSPQKVLAAGIAVLLAAGVYTLHNFLEEQWGQLTNSSIGKAIGSGWNGLSSGIGWLYDGTVQNTAKVLIGTDKIINKIFGIPKGTTTAVIGGLAAGLVAGFAFAASIPAIATMGVIGGLVGLTGSTMSGTLEPLLTGFTNSISQLPGIGGFLGGNSDQALGLRPNQFVEEGSPISAMTASQAIASDIQRYLLEAADTSGQKTKALFSNPTMYGQGYRQDEPNAQLFGKLNSSMVNSLIDREMTIKAQYYNQTVIGSAMWAKLIYGADNYNDLKQITQLQRIYSPVAAVVHKRIQAHVEHEVKKLQQNIVKKGKGERITENELKIIDAYNKATQSEVDKPNQQLQTTAFIHKSELTNKSLQNKINQANNPNGPSPVLTLSVKAESNNSCTVINKKISSKNSLALAYTQDKVNTYNCMPGYSY